MNAFLVPPVILDQGVGAARSNVEYQTGGGERVLIMCWHSDVCVWGGGGSVSPRCAAETQDPDVKAG